MKMPTELESERAAEVRRIQRIRGQLEGVRRMIEEDRACADILTQTKAVAAAVRALESSVLERYVLSCAQQSMQTGNIATAKKFAQEIVQVFRKRMVG